MKRILGSVVLFVLLVLTVIALSKVGVPKATGLSSTAKVYAAKK